MGRAIDVSKYQGVIDYDELPADIDTVLMQATNGLTGVDPEFAHNWSEALRTKRTPVPYHYAYPDDAVDYGGAHAQAVHFYDTVKATAGGTLTIEPRLALDLEERNGSVQWAIEFMSQLTDLDGLLPYFYSNYAYIMSTLKGGVGLGSVSLLWLADVGVAKPPVPPGWPTVTLWQDSFTGSEPGVDGHVDEDVEVTPVTPPAPPVPPAQEELLVDTATFVRLMYASLVFRVPTDENLTEWSTYVADNGPAAAFIAFSAEPEAVAKRAKIAQVLTPSTTPNGQ